MRDCIASTLAWMASARATAAWASSEATRADSAALRESASIWRWELSADWRCSSAETKFVVTVRELLGRGT
jgi:hypothetical protein